MSLEKILNLTDLPLLEKMEPMAFVTVRKDTVKVPSSVHLGTRNELHQW